eukprot:TRINITY_DN900_c0_g1_i3.p1 TRINITY_DN900_c0_g1~~TRINITY_DN900_c0_g1_i3.p1  ORF type:complete len:250 (-),score=17.16 TRINITY_DN900_c0_g1_i3:265-1014(-)
MAAAFHVSTLCSKPLSLNSRRSKFHLRSGYRTHFCSISGYLTHEEHGPKLEPPRINNLFSSFGESVGKSSVLVFFGASLFFIDPALAFKTILHHKITSPGFLDFLYPNGGGPYGAGVTRGQDLTGTDFSGKSLIKQDFKTSILRQANFKGAKLLGASFFDADLTGADLSDADLRGADFSLANVTKANLSNANLEGALATGNTSFRGSIISGADFTDVPLRDDQREYLCKAADGVNPTTGNATRDTLYCK